MKRLFAWLLCLVMILSMIPAAAAEDIEIIEIDPAGVEPGPWPDPEEITIIDPEAVTEEPADEPAAETVASGECGQNLTWTLDSNGKLTVSGTGNMYNYMGDEAPWKEWREQIKTLVIRDGVTTIGVESFRDCVNLKSAVISGSVEDIGMQAFLNDTGLTSLTLNEGLLRISYEAFSGCTALQSFTLPGSVVDLGMGCFFNCSSLTTVSLNDKLTIISNYAFKGCSSLESLTIPDNIQSIAASAFADCTGLTHVTIPENLTALGQYAFSGCTGLTSAGPIGSGCSVEFGWTQETPDYAFSGCTGLENVTIPAGIQRIGAAAFANCTALASVTIPDTTTSIDAYAFSGCESLADVNYDGYEDAVVFNKRWKWSSVDNDPLYDAAWHYGRTPEEGWQVCGNDLLYRIEDSSQTLRVKGSGAMWSFRHPTNAIDNRPWAEEADGLRHIVLEPGVTSIGDYAFFTFSALLDVTIPDGLTGIGQSAFEYCRGLSAVTIPDGVSALGDSAFGYCEGLTELSLGSGLLSIGNNCFNNCKMLTIMAIPDSVTVIGEGAFGSCSQLSEITLGSGLKEIRRFAFSSCSSLRSVTIPKKVKLIGKVAFNGCTGLTEICFLGSAPTFESSCFNNVTATAYYPGSNSSWKESVRKDYGGTITWVGMAKPTITTQPESRSADADTTVKFSVVAEGAESYQWQYRTSSSGTWKDSALSGNKTASLNVKATEARNGYQYRCKLTNRFGTTTSSAATLTVLSKPAITTQPANQSAASGETVQFTVAATGSSLKYQWYYRTSASGSWAKSTGTGSATATLTVEAKTYRDGYQYRCRVSNDLGYVYSSAATLTVLPKPTITTQPSSKTVSAGTTVKFTVKATGAVSYQWYYRTSSTGTWNKCTGTGAATATLTVEAKSYRSGYQYRCKVSNDAGYVYSSAATLTVK